MPSLKSLVLSLLSTSALTAASIIPRDDAYPTWYITDFSTVSGPSIDDPFHYSLVVSVDTLPPAHCAVENCYPDVTCGNASAPYSFPSSVCGDSNFSWSLTKGMSVTQPPQPGFSLQISLAQPGCETLYGCYFIVGDGYCDLGGADNPMDQWMWNPPTSFTMTPSTNPQCIYA